MELHQLRYFTAVAELESFTRAARHCFVSQPSLSQQIIKLEHELGQPLFERLGRRVRLTPAGRTLYDRAVRILSAVREARASLDVVGDWKEGALSVGAILTVAPYPLPGILKRFRKAFPHAQVTIREDFTSELVRSCLTGELDIAIVALPMDDDRLVVKPLFTESLLLALPATDPGWGVRRPTLADLARLPFVLLDEMHCLGNQVVRFCQQRDCRPPVACHTAQLQTVQQMVGLGMGVSLVPELAARSDRTGQCRYLSLGPDGPTRTLAAIWHRDRYQSRLAMEFLNRLRQSTLSRRGSFNCPPGQRGDAVAGRR
jgi:LysR family hydrogen peroxide-inducible transcriptional activator